ncbi:carboxypeptidase-like regulatory domain-containing protein [Gemmatimonas sp.]|uniref:MSCRAMM family protein n=1 Tax=Gemmatimonas sp. TaxID=1962908 RepID=UPI00286A48B9|nr:carboxypeptidase-like regulatory domain-containing protein [Gemmatimonas sp.]
MRRRQGVLTVRSALFAAMCAALYTATAAAQSTVPTRRDSTTSSRATVYGIVNDSIAARPLAGAVVQLVTTDTLANFGRTIVSDSTGRFTFEDVPAGRYTLGFFHPMLDSLGLDPILRSVSATGVGAVRADLAVPSPAKLRTAICGAPNAQGTGGVLIGSVHSALGRAPAAGVTVIAEWIELTFGTGGMTRRMPRRTATTRENGWFSLCNVPGPGLLMLMATRGADSTAMVEVQVPATGFQRRELYLGPARVAAGADSTRRVHVGEGRLSGIVGTTTDGRLLSGAQISIVDGPQTRSNARGEWALTDAPPGTRMLEVRAVGYYPERRAVDIVDSIAPLRVALATFKSVLDTMKISATRTVDQNLVGFQERRRSSVGRFLTPRDIAVRQPFTTSEIFRSVPGLFLDRTMDAEEKVMMRGLFADRCEPAIYINGQWMNALTSGDLDGFIRPNDIAGIEVYAAGQVPAQFQPGLGGCGSLVFWTK